MTGYRIVFQKGLRAQPAMELLMTYGWAILIIVVMVGTLAYYISLPRSIVPSTCSFSQDVLCKDMFIVSSQSSETVVYLNITNEGQYPFQTPQLWVSYGSLNSTAAACFPSFVQPGGSMECAARLPISTSLNQYMSGSLYLNVSVCGLLPNYTSTEGCTGPPSEILTGSYVGDTSPTNSIEAVGGYAYCVGTAASQGNSVYYAPVYLTGGIGNWIKSTSYPIQMVDAGCTIYDSYIYCVGSGEGSGVASSYYAPIIANGIGEWASTTQYPVPLYNGSCSSYNGYIYCVGTESTSPYNQVYYASITPKGIGQWKQTTAYPDPDYGASCSVYNGYIYCVDTEIGGGTDSWYAPLSNQGVGSWTEGPSYPVSGNNAGCAAWGGAIFCQSSSSSTSSYYSVLDGNGVIDGWKPTTQLSTNLLYSGCMPFSRFLYCFGSYNQPSKNQVWYAAINTTGVTGSWTETTQYPVGIYKAWCAISGDSGGFYG